MTTKKYSLRKVKVGVASVLVGFGIATTGAVVAHAEDATPAPAPAPASGDKAKEEAAQKDFLANFDKALDLTVKELEKADTNNDPVLEKTKKENIAKLKEVAAANRAEIEEAFKNGATAADAEKFLAESKKTPEAAGKDVEAKKLTADETKKLDEAEKEAKEYEANAPESEKLQDKIDVLNLKIEDLKKRAEEDTKAAADKAKELEEAKKNNNTAEVKKLEAEIQELLSSAEAKKLEVNELIEEYNETLSDLEEADRSETSEAALDKLEEERTNLEYEIFKLEEKIKTATGEELKNLKSELSEKRIKLVELTATVERTSDDFEVEDLQNKVANLERKLSKRQDKLKELKANGADADEIAELEEEIQDLEADLDELEADLEKLLEGLEPEDEVSTTAIPPVAEELPEFTGGVNGAEPAVLEKPEFKFEKTNEGRNEGKFVVEEGKAKDDEAKDETKEGSLPNTGMTTSSTAALGLSLIALVALAVRRKLNN